MVDTNDLSRAHAASDTEIFISYRNKAGTAPHAQLLAELLTQRGMNVFWDAERIASGDLWKPVLGTALESPKLAVGVVLMTAEWFHHFDPDFTEDVVAWEVDTLLTTEHVKVIPVVLRDQQTGDVRPEVPVRAANPDDLAALKRGLERRQFRFVPPRTPKAMRELADDIVDAALATALGRPLHKGVAAGRTPPLPLHVVHAEPAVGRGLLDMASMLEHRGRQHRFMTIRGQDALLAHDWDQAVTHLRQARDNIGREADPSARSDDDPFWDVRSHLWRIHVQNMFALASLGGERPRRLTITDAKKVLQALLLAVEIGSERLGRWPLADDAQARADRLSAAYVLETTLDLLWLLWRDFYLRRNVRPPDMQTEGLQEFLHRLREIKDRIVALRPPAGVSPAAEERRFLVEHAYLEGFPWGDDDNRAWGAGTAGDELERIWQRDLDHRQTSHILRELGA